MLTVELTAWFGLWDEGSDVSCWAFGQVSHLKAFQTNHAAGLTRSKECRQHNTVMNQARVDLRPGIAGFLLNSTGKFYDTTEGFNYTLSTCSCHFAGPGPLANFEQFAECFSRTGQPMAYHNLSVSERQRRRIPQSRFEPCSPAVF